MTRCVVWLPFASALLAQTVSQDLWTYRVEPCTAEAVRESHCQAGDDELARWALEAWRQSAGGALQVKPAPEHALPRLTIRWATGRDSLYGEARSVEWHGMRGAEVYVLPAAANPGADPLLRDAVLYLTCLHETGHALGLAHTDRFEDIMYSFQFGGDIPEYFARYRRKLKTRADIAKTSAISPADRAALLGALGR